MEKGIGRVLWGARKFSLLIGLLALVALVAGCGGCGGSGPERVQAPDVIGQAADRAETAPRVSQASVRLAPIGTFVVPVAVVAPPGDRNRLFVVERDGRIKLLVNGQLQRRPFLDLSRDVVITSPNAGLLSMAFAPDYARTGRFYVYFTERTGIRIKEFRRSARSRNVADRRTGRNVLFQREPFRDTEHVGGQLVFGPDRLLYIGIGDGDVGGFSGDLLRGSSSARRLNTLLGKIVRIDPRESGRRPYRVPKANPFVGRARARPEIFSYGVRNPWRFSFDPANGALIVADVGHGHWEEVNYVSRRRARGADFGWPALEGRHPFDTSQTAPRSIVPAIEYAHVERPGDPDLICSGAVIGGNIVRDRRVPALRGRYLYGDYCTGELRSFNPSAPQQTDAPVPNISVPGVHSFGEDARGRTYVVGSGEPVGYPPAGERAAVYRVVSG